MDVWVIDDNLTWKEHVHYLCNKLVKYTGIFYRLRKHLPYNTAIQLYYAFLYSRISYGIEVYGKAKSSILKPLQIIQNRVLKILTFKPSKYSTNILHRDLNLLKISDIYTLRTGTLIYKYTQNSLPPIFNNILNPSPPVVLNIQTRNNKFFSTTKQNNKYGHLMLNNCCCKLWQNIPLYIKGSKSLNLFKNNIRLFLLESYI